MNKTVNINLAGIFFHIDENAYLKLSRYLEAIKRSFTDSQGRAEIIADIEARIAELFAERIQNDKQVVGIKLVDEVIAIMGQPEDYLVDDEIFEDAPKKQSYNYASKPTKKLYRDTDSSYIGGVAAGLGHFLGIDMLWIRLIWILLTLFSGGTFIIIYIIFWALVPEAKTTAEKLMMSGDEVTISNIEKKIKDGFDSVSESIKNVDFQKQGEKIKEGFEHVADNISETVKNVDVKKQGNRIRSGSQKFFDTIGNIVVFFLKVIAKFIGVILIVVGITTLISLIVAFFSVGVVDAVHFPPMNFIDAANASNIPLWLMSILLLLAIGIPFFFVFYLGLKILVNNLKSIGKVAKFTLLGLWIMAVIGLIVAGVKQASEHAFDAKVVNKEVLNIQATDTLTLRMNTKENEYSNFSYGRNEYQTFIEDDKGKQLVSSKVKLIVRSTKENNAYIIVEKEARGSTYEVAKQRATNINYQLKLTNGVLLLNDYLTTAISNKFAQQNVTLLLYLPEGTTLYADYNTYNYHRNSRLANDILDNGMEEHYLKVLNGEMKCLDCNNEDNINTDKNINDKKESTKNNQEKPNISVTIDEEDGVDIQFNDN